MARIALICPPFAAHLACFEALGQELLARGHQPFFLLNAGAGIPTRRFATHHVAGRPGDPDIADVLDRAEQPGGIGAIFQTIADSAALTDQLCDGGPARLREHGAEMIVGDQMEPAAFLLAEALGLPFLGVACAVPIDPAPGVPLPFLDWPYQPQAEAKLRRTAAIGDLLSRKQNQTLERWSKGFGIAPRRRLADCRGAHQIAQMVPAFDFPRPEPSPFLAVGPIRGAGERRPLPFAPPTDRPLVFATMGTLLGGNLKLWRAIARACREAGAALVVAHGGKLGDAEAASLDAHHVAPFLPYAETMAAADLVITHGGSNTVLDALAAGKPLLVRPVGFDQPGNLARIRHHRLGEKLESLHRPARIAAQVRRVLADTAMRERCVAVGKALKDAGGTPRAADYVERILSTAEADRRAAG